LIAVGTLALPELAALRAIGGGFKLGRAVEAGLAADAAAAAERTTLEEVAATACRGKSFSPETGVVLASGVVVPISQFKVGDQVRTTDPATGKTTTQAVTAVWVNHDTDLMDVTVSVHGVTSTIHTTQHHPFWDVTRHAWVDANQLTPGDQLTTADGTIAVVAATVVVPGAADMWDLTIANTHDFYVYSLAPGKGPGPTTSRLTPSTCTMYSQARRQCWCIMLVRAVLEYALSASKARRRPGSSKTRRRSSLTGGRAYLANSRLLLLVK
jgi:hypothetical protein